MKSNPLIRSVVHKSFKSAMADLGLPELKKIVFTTQIRPYLRAPGSLFEESQASMDKLFKAVNRGRIIATEADDEFFTFFVRCKVGGRVADIRLRCHHQDWEVESVVAMFHQPITKLNWFYRMAFAVSVIIAGVIGYAIHGSAEAASATIGKGQAMTGATAPASGQAKVANNNTTGQDAKPGTTTSNSTSSTSTTSKSSKPAPAKPKTLTFTLKSGMSIHDISVYLHANGLIHEPAIQFDMTLKNHGIDRTIRPGTYTFKSGMSQSQILSVLQAGPK